MARKRAKKEKVIVFGPRPKGEKCERFKHLKLCARPTVGGYEVIVYGKHDTFPMSGKFRTSRAALTHAKTRYRALLR